MNQPFPLADYATALLEHLRALHRVGARPVRDLAQMAAEHGISFAPKLETVH